MYIEVITSPVLGSTATAAGLPGTAIVKNATEISEGVYSCEVNFNLSKQITKLHSNIENFWPKKRFVIKTNNILITAF
jgi:hypothetical protein